ncbi:MAG TPA: cytochrome C oxidase subunit IV family protein [Chthoniobacteraceae bacterium]|nr:cytochrome C oxidase subunit IV family protein [Chthoniobacteraceae bacterium]
MSDAHQPSDLSAAEKEHPVSVPHDAEHFHAHVKLYLGVGAALLLGTVVTVIVTQIHFGSEAMNIAVGLLVAAIKASLVILFFMHMKEEKGSIYQFMIPTTIIVAGLFLICALALVDHIKF